MPRMLIQMDDDRGTYSFPLGAKAAPLAEALEDIEDWYASLWDDNDVLEITLEPLTGWGTWRWALHVGPATYFLSGEGEPEPSELPFGDAPRKRSAL